MKNKRRIFIALPISPGVQEMVFDWAKNYQHLPVRWLAGKNLHLTLIPPWYEMEIDRVSQKLKKFVWSQGILTLSFRRILYGPDPRRPRLIWVQGPTPPALVELKTTLEQHIGVQPERRPLKLHLTLARFRPENFSRFPLKHLEDAVSWAEKVSEVVLMESHLARTGADYEILAHVPLS